VEAENMKHKIKNVDIDVCCCEQKIAYNYLFSWTFNEHDKIFALQCIKEDLKRRKDTDMKRYDTEYIYELIEKNYDKYINEHTPIFGDYTDLGKFVC
jgi:hypothetical protein